MNEIIINSKKKVVKNLNIILLPETVGGNIITQKANQAISGKVKTQIFYDTTGRKYPVKTELLLYPQQLKDKNIKARCTQSSAKFIELEGVVVKEKVKRIIKRNSNIKIKK